MGDFELLRADEDDASVAKPGDDLLLGVDGVRNGESDDGCSETRDELAMASVKLPEDDDGFFSAGKEVGAVRGEGEARDGVGVPVKDGRRRCGRGDNCSNSGFPLDEALALHHR